MRNKKNKKYNIIEGYIATENKEVFLGQIKINNKTGLIMEVKSKNN